MSQISHRFPSFEVLSETSHSHVSVVPEIDFSAFAYLTQTSVTVSEFAALSCSFPLFFIKDPQFGSFQSIALLSLDSVESENEVTDTTATPPATPYFCHGDGRYIASLPASLMLHPFSLVHDPADEARLTMGINTNSQLMQPEGLPLFNSDGSPTEYLQTVEQNLSQYFNDQLLTQNVTDQLVSLNLLQAFDVQVSYTNSGTSNNEQTRTTTLKGLYNINEEQLMQLGDSDKLALFNNGVLAAVYAMLASISQLNRLIQLHGLQHSNNGQPVISGISMRPAE